MINTIIALAAVFGGLEAPSPENGAGNARLEKPVRIMVNGAPIRAELGYAAPCWTDVDGDGTRDLLVGQYGGGKIRYFRNRGEGVLSKGSWLKAGKSVATIPGIW
jgi:hypothetical protein|tara:strand:- start:262 stop:576 length:315 start_codon:yes stop_codon:yes gene_type:complete